MLSESHERFGKWLEPFVKCLQGRFTAEYITDEGVLAKARSSEAHSLDES
jgi:hypothetical protein